jgi:hypothetical protein
VQEAFTKAPSASTLYVPSAQTIREIALALPDPRPREPEAHPAAALQESSTLSPTNPFLNLAHKWEYESLDLGLDADRPSTKHINVRRLKELFSLLDRFGPQDIPEVQDTRRVRREVAV